MNVKDLTSMDIDYDDFVLISDFDVSIRGV